MNNFGNLADTLQEIEREQRMLARLHQIQQSESGQVALKAKREIAEKMERIINKPLFIGEVDCITDSITGEKKFFYKKG